MLKWFEQFKEIERLNKLLIEKNESIRVLNNEVKSLERKVDELTASYRDQPMVVDFNAINAFAIERNIYNGNPTTIIGYYVQEETHAKIVKEWYLYCNDETHAKIVKQFETHIATKDAK